MSDEPDKLDLIQWADRRREVDLQAKVILQKFAAFADGEGRTWRKVADLAEDANCSIRTVHSRLRWLEENGYVRPTGEQHRLKDSTRSVPIYVLRPTFEAEDLTHAGANSMCANSAYMQRLCVQPGTGMCATGCTCIDTLGTSEEYKSAGARAGEEVETLAQAYARLEAAYHPAALGFTDPKAALAALADLLGQGVDLGDLIAAAADCRDSPLMRKRDFGPVSLQRWLSETRWRGFGPFLARAEAARSPGGGSGAVAAWAGPAGLWAAVVEAKGERLGAMLLAERTRVDGGRVVCASAATFRELSKLAGIFEQHGCELVAPNGGE